MKARTVEQLNHAAAPLLHGATFCVVNGGRLKLYLPPERFTRNGCPRFIAADVREDRKWFRWRRVARWVGMGGTDEQTLCQLVLWWRGEPRLPGRVLKHWQERRAGFCQALDAIGYDDERSLNCVLCGRTFRGIDWWCLNGVIGPCCFGGQC